MAFTRWRIAVFVDGCYWHGCPEHGPRKFGTNAEFWTDKIAANRVRDEDTNNRLRAAGWAVMRFWEHDDPEEAARRVATLVRRAQANR